MEGVKKEWDETDPNISKLLESLDRDLLLVLRTQTLLRGINVDLGGVVNRYKVNARSAIKGINARNPNASRIAFWFERMSLELKFWVADVVMWFSSVFFPSNARVLKFGERH